MHHNILLLDCSVLRCAESRRSVCKLALTRSLAAADRSVSGELAVILCVAITPEEEGRG